MASETEPRLNFAEALGVDAGISAQCFSVYIPDKSRDGTEIGNQRQWVLEALNLLGQINGGATAMPPCEGVWRNEQAEVIQEHPVVVYSYVVPEAFLANLGRIREFLHRLGRETNQGEVAFEFDGSFYRIHQFDEG
ncbi:MAG TPA: hypothetical protein VML55_17120 [Planctomycetaceae bacterium]|nr:hypothetical protein [Planctomycetaceae bacterium]